ncbi:MAG: Lar family restriction alleviation protein [Lachnospiraceae bacterium]|nr:Lar family restriction alleviation protein [Lachnospiraceae bacterium]
MEEGLKPCPFCGSEDIHLIDRIDCSNGLQNYYHTKCKACGASTDEFGCKFDALVAWNRRVEK